MKVIKKPTWWIVLYFLPVANLIVNILVSLELAKAFGRSAGFGIVLLWLTPFGYLILAFGNSTYVFGTTTSTSAPESSQQPPPAIT